MNRLYVVLKKLQKRHLKVIFIIESNISFFYETIEQKILKIYYTNQILFINVKFYLKCDNAFAQKSFEILLIFVKIFFHIYYAIKFFAIQFRVVFKTH